MLLPWKCSSLVAELGVEPEGTRGGPSTLASGCGIGMTTLGSQGRDRGKLGTKVQGGAPKWRPNE